MPLSLSIPRRPVPQVSYPLSPQHLTLASTISKVLRSSKTTQLCLAPDAKCVTFSVSEKLRKSKLSISLGSLLHCYQQKTKYTIVINPKHFIYYFPINIAMLIAKTYLSSFIIIRTKLS